MTNQLYDPFTNLCDGGRKARESVPYPTSQIPLSGISCSHFRGANVALCVRFLEQIPPNLLLFFDIYPQHDNQSRKVDIQVVSGVLYLGFLAVFLYFLVNRLCHTQVALLK